MAQPPDIKRTTGISDEAVRAKTGKAWADWFAILDRGGAAQVKHKEIAKLLHEKHCCAPWWSQMITVGYERARGLREKHQTATGYSVSGSKTIGASANRLFRAWRDDVERRHWLKAAKFEIRKATPPKSLRIVWDHGESRVEVMFYARCKNKVQVSVQHLRLADRNEAAKMKGYWAKALNHLRAHIES